MSKATKKTMHNDTLYPFEREEKNTSQKHPVEERDALVRMIRRSPESANFWFELGKYLMEKGDYDEAEDALLTAVELDDNNRETWLLLVWIYEIQGMREEASMAIEMVEMLTKEENDLLNLQFFGDNRIPEAA